VTFIAIKRRTLGYQEARALLFCVLENKKLKANKIAGVVFVNL
jgi:hypothetical protein